MALVTPKTLNILTRGVFHSLGFGIYRLPKTVTRLQGKRIPDWHYYRPLFSPWLGYGEFAKYYDVAEKRTLVSRDRCWILYSLCLQSFVLDGDIWECGVYKGGTAAMLAQLICDHSPGKRLHLFDTFEGMPETDPRIDFHRKGQFADTTLGAVRDYVKHDDKVMYHPGTIPSTFLNVDKAPIAFAHVDVDIKQSVFDCCEFIFPRLSVGGCMVFDDYGFPSCAGARQAVDEYFAGRQIIPLVLPTGQAIVYKPK
jgi:O-methyltransferase